MFAESATREAAGCMACRDAARPLRRPEEREEHRRSLHKGSSPNWKDAYRQVREATRKLSCIVEPR